jgi:sterol desaturase/sphingolipid hydroxylase (fatty acid hydroxylase superfamily)
VHDTLSWYALGIPAYVIYVALEMRFAQKKSFSFAETISNWTAGLGTLIIGLFLGPLVVRAWDFTHAHVPWRWPDHAWWKFPAALLISDFCYYIYHRAGHRFAIFWSIHGVHHQHEYLNSSVGFRLEWLADPYAALFFGLMPLAGVDSTTGFFAVAVLSAYTLTAHTPLLSRPSWGFMVTPAIHGSHHSRDARYFGCNYGAMLGFWDRLFGTWREPEPGEELRHDVPSICRTHNGVTAQFGLVGELWRALRRRPTLRGKLQLLWSPPALAEGEPLRDDAEIARPLQLYVFVHFLLLVPVAAWLLWMREVRPLPVQIGCSLILIGGLYTLGALLDGRRRAVTFEQLRLAATLALGVGLWWYSPPMALTLAGMALAGLVLTPRLAT